jgi:tRNA-dihydrouridine synthase B
MAFSWQQCPKPIIGLAPMDGLTDYAYRQIHAKYGKPAVMFTEFTNVEGMFLSTHDHLLNDLRFHVDQRPIIAQIFGSTPEYFYKAAIICADLGFDGIDINMGCPAKNVAHHGGGAALIAKPELAKQIVRSVKEGVKDWANGKSIYELGLDDIKLDRINELKKFSGAIITRQTIPVSVKTRLGVEEITIEEWVKHLLEVSPANITLHGRTLKQMYTGRADWEAIAKGAAIIKTTSTTALGNGDVISRDDALEKIKQFGLDGVLIARASMGNPYIWHETTTELTPVQKLEIAREHAQLHAQVKNEKMFLQMRKHFSFYISNFPNANEIKIKLIQTKTVEEAESIIAETLAVRLQELKHENSN